MIDKSDEAQHRIDAFHPDDWVGVQPWSVESFKTSLCIRLQVYDSNEDLATVLLTIDQSSQLVDLIIDTMCKLRDEATYGSVPILNGAQSAAGAKPAQGV